MKPCIVENFPVISSERLTLRSHQESDKKAYFDLMSNEEAMRFYGRVPMKEHTEVDIDFETIENGFRTSNFIKWAIELNSSHQLIGGVGAWGLQNPHNRATISCLLSPEFWKKGLACEALLKMVEYLFEALNKNRLHLYVDPVNTRAVNLFKRVGFKHEGILREYEYENGKFIDIAIMSFLKQDFISSK